MRLVAALVAAAACACTSKSASDAAPTVTTGAGAAGGIADGGAGGAGTATDAGTCQGHDPGVLCGLITYTLGDFPIPADVLILLDKSSSMSDQWGAVTDALMAQVTRTEGDINWGLKYFSNAAGACGATGPAEIAPGKNIAAAIAAAIASTTPSGNTPTRFALQAAADYLTTLTAAGDVSPKYILLVTDGASNCCAVGGGVTCPDAPAAAGGETSLDDTANATVAAAATYQQGAGFPVFVVGAGTTADALTALNDLAVAGGASQAPDSLGRRYLSLDDPGPLETVLTSLTAVTISCTFRVRAPAPAPNNIEVLADTKVIQHDPVNGWSYSQDMMSIVLNGAACDLIKSGQVHTLSEIVGCPGLTLCIP